MQLQRLGAALAGAALAMIATAALADDASAPPPPDKSKFTLFNPTPDADLRSLCTDRPTKSTGTCTIDAGHWQVESDIYNVTFQTQGGVTTRTELFTNPNLKLGLTNTLDIEVNWSPWQQVTTHDHATDTTTVAAGVGDVFVRAKWNLLGDDGGNVAFALVPWVKVPTAPSSVGNGKVEAGFIPAIQLNLPKNWQLVIDPEVDMLLNASGGGYHANTSGLLSFSYPLTKELTGSFEIWGDANFDPARTVTQASFDLGIAWIPSKVPTLQLDGGVNLGLNKQTPAAQVYTGVSKRF